MTRLWEVSGSMSKKQNINFTNCTWEIIELNKQQQKSQLPYNKSKDPQHTRLKTSCINGGNNEMLENNNARKHDISRWVYRCKHGDICLTVAVPAVSIYKAVGII